MALIKSFMAKPEKEQNNKMIDNYLFFNNKINTSINKFTENITLKKTVKNPTIGLMINSFHNNYNLEIWKGVNDAVIKNGGKIISFFGASINNPNFDNKFRNQVYKLPSPVNLDGLLIVSSSIGSYISQDEIENFVNSFKSIPCISIGTKITNIPSIYIENKNGFKELMIHLIEDHKYKNIAFIHGPKKNKDALERFITYKKVLNQYNIKINPDLIIQGSYYTNFGKEAVIKLIDERKIEFDALIGSNDYVAINAVTELENRGIKVPQDIAVVGYDNISECRFITHPLTTVNQPTYDIGYEAGKQITSLINGEKISLNQEFKSNIVIRESCGCLNNNDIKDKKNIIINTQKIYINKQPNIDYIISLIIKVMKKAFPEIITVSYLYEWAEILLMSLIRNLENKSIDIFLIKFREIINNPKLRKIDIHSWNYVLYFIFENIAPKINNDLIKCNELLLNALKEIQMFSAKNIKNSIIQTNELSRTLSLFKKKIQCIKNRDILEQIIHNILPLFGIKSIYITAYHKNKHINSNQNSLKLLIGYKNYKIIKKGLNDFKYNHKDIIPGGIKYNNTTDPLILFPYNNKHELLGFIVYEIEKNKINSHDFLEIQLGNICEDITKDIGNIVISIMMAEKNTEDKPKDSINLKYKLLNLNEEKIREFLNKISLYMEKEKPYIDCTLTLPVLAEKLEIPRNHLSYILNEYLNINFYDFINKYRIKEVKNYLERDRDEKINYLEIAYDSGFKSKSTFNKIFKKYTTMTPSSYRVCYLERLK